MLFARPSRLLTDDIADDPLAKYFRETPSPCPGIGYADHAVASGDRRTAWMARWFDERRRVAEACRFEADRGRIRCR